MNCFLITYYSVGLKSQLQISNPSFQISITIRIVGLKSTQLKSQLQIKKKPSMIPIVQTRNCRSQIYAAQLNFFRGCIGTICPYYLFGKNAEVLGSNSFMGSCTTHCIICGIINSCCCLAFGGLLLALQN